MVRPIIFKPLQQFADENNLEFSYYCLWSSLTEGYNLKFVDKEHNRIYKFQLTTDQIPLDKAVDGIIEGLKRRMMDYEGT